MANLEELQQVVLNNIVEIVEDDVLTPRTVLHPCRQDPFNLSDRQFLKIYRLSKEAARELIHILEPHLTAPTRISAMDKATKVINVYWALHFRQEYETKPVLKFCIYKLIVGTDSPSILRKW